MKCSAVTLLMEFLGMFKYWGKSR
ncbi:hypothetical protein, partial [Enterobacter rongchengensis]